MPRHLCFSWEMKEGENIPTESHRDWDGTCQAVVPHTPLPFPDPPVTLRCPWIPRRVGQVPFPAPQRGGSRCRPSPALRAEGPTLTFFAVRLGRKQSPEQKEPEGELHAAAAGAQPRAGRTGGRAGSPRRLRPPCPGCRGQRMGRSRSSRARRARCTSARLAHGGDERSRRVGGEALLPLPVPRGWSQTSHLAGK